jgi:TatD DNase family protein
LAKQILNQNCYISVGEKFNPETIQIIPVNKLFIETDESLKKIEDIYQHIAHIRETNSDELLEKITKNFKIIFKI